MPWRAAMKMVRIEGTAHTLSCVACKTDGTGGDTPYQSAATGEFKQPEDWYVAEGGFGPYCTSCASKIAQGEDTTRSVTQFYDNTKGTQIAVEHLEES